VNGQYIYAEVLRKKCISWSTQAAHHNSQGQQFDEYVFKQAKLAFSEQCRTCQ